MNPNPTNAKSSNALPLGYKLGEYTIVAVLGDGGFGITYRARDTKLGLDVAIKEYFPGIYASRTQASTIVPKSGNDLGNYRWGLEAFLKEAQALAKFKHPQIVRVLRFLEANGTAYTIMEYEEGETLSAYLRRQGGILGEPRLLQIFLPILNGLHAVHDAGLLHLDIKPDNIYLRSNEQPMLIDFGSSRQMRGNTEDKVTLTPGYCAPEQYPGNGAIGVASDVYGMGATLYRCITGKNPIDAMERKRVIAKLLSDPLLPATSFERPPYAAHIRESVDLALTLAAEERPASAFALQQALMGKDLTKIAARPTASLYRPGTGFIGTLPPPPQQEPKPTLLGRRYSFFEKFVALTVFIATFAVITPKVLIDTGRISESDFYSWLDDAQTRIVEKIDDAGDWINERVFGVAPRPRVTRAPTPPRPRKAARTAPVETVVRTPFGADLRRAPDIVLPDSAPRAVGFLKHGAILAVATADGLLQFWDVTTGEARATLPTQISRAAALGVFPTSQWVAAMDRDEMISVFDPLGHREYVLRNDPPHAIEAITVSTNALQLAELSTDHGVTIWELAQQRPQVSWVVDGNTVPLLVFSPDERMLLTADTSGDITAWNTADGTRLTRWHAHERALVALAFAPNGRQLASADAAGELRIWKAAADAGWQTEYILVDAPPTVSDVAFSPDGRWLIAVGGNGNVYVWDAADGTLANRLFTDRTDLRTLAISDDGRFLAVATDDNIIRLWK